MVRQHGKSLNPWSFLVVIPVLFFVYRDIMMALPLTLSVFAALLWHYLYKLTALLTPLFNLASNQSKALYYLPMVCLFLLTYGYCQASVDIRNIEEGRGKKFVVFKDHQQFFRKPLLKEVKKGVVTYDKNKEVLFYPRNKVGRIEWLYDTHVH